MVLIIAICASPKDLANPAGPKNCVVGSASSIGQTMFSTLFLVMVTLFIM